ncbi:hypothetical protein [Brachybacterium fresconis]|uniref:Uncharacterized protein n=1 Tax=Brachybacterium fresconis TaxID=173363 RepID=A0ABS4YN64_9MICO|nr:hypothetical protein [Brachybacterium fresconis]MBP2410226.1 hypothetical protein [Brachybacterium fresconis]
MDRDVLLRAARLRTRIDRAGREAWEHTARVGHGSHMQKHEIRAFLGAAAVGDAELTVGHFRLLRQVYSDLSNVMHGRWSAAHFTGRHAEEWERAVDAILGEEAD